MLGVAIALLGLNLYANPAWALWAGAVPVPIGAAHDGRMGEHFLLGLVTLFYAVVCFVVLQWTLRQSENPISKGS